MNTSTHTAQAAEPESSTDYQRVAAAIEFLGSHVADQPTLAEVAEHVSLSEFHFQRLFRRWAGISPKRFVQYLTAAHTRELLETAPSLLDAALEAGLSGPGRLHDLFVSVLAMTPAQARDGGAGLTLTYGIATTPFGNTLVAHSDKGICNLEFLDHDHKTPTSHSAIDVQAMDEAARARLTEYWPGAILVRDDGSAQATCENVFPGDGRTIEPGLVLHVRGTNFQVRVWEALLSIPEGAVVGYEDLAQRLDMPGAARAVASAVARNPVGFLIPCHRVIRATGVIGEYRWGSVRKKALIGWESARTHG